MDERFGAASTKDFHNVAPMITKNKQMPVTYNNIYNSIIDIENLYAAFREAQRGKRYKPSVLLAYSTKEEFLHKLHQKLTDGTWASEPYHVFLCKKEVKSRIVYAPTFHDRVVHHAVCRILMPLFEQKFIFDSYAITPGKGTHKAVKRVQQYLRETNAYFLQCDIHHYYNSVDHGLLKKFIRQTIRDRKVLWLFDEIIDSYHDPETGEGIPIGALTSQLCANIYLDKLDHFVKDELGCKHYLRYMDDFVLFGSKSYLRNMLDQIIRFLDGLHLQLNSRTKLAPAKQGVDFAGYRTYTTHIKMRKRNVLAARRRFCRYERLYTEWQADIPDVSRRVASFLGYAKHANSYTTVNSVLGNIKLKRGERITWQQPTS